MPQENQQLTIKFVKSSKGENMFRAPRNILKQWIDDRRHFLSLLELILNTYSG